MYAIIDIETTGGNAQSDQITEIGIVLHDGDRIVGEWDTLIDPERRIPYRISSITGITDALVEGAPKFYEVARKVVELTEGCTLVAHNAKFDYGFIRNAFKSLGFEYKRPVICTVELSRSLLPGQRSYQLGQLCAALGIVSRVRHRALADAHATTQLFEHLQGLARKRALDVADSSQISRMSPDANLKKEQIDKLPRTAGVYYFYDADHQLIYVGKSVDIRSRVLSHFANNTNVKALEMKACIAHIRYAETGSELVALLKESDEIKRFKPKFNRSQRRSRYNIGLWVRPDEQGYLQMRVERLRAVGSGKGPEPTAAFTSLTEAKGFLERMVEEYALCQKHMGLHKVKGACFYHGIHKCAGACVGLESVEAYNARAEAVLHKLQYAGRNLLIVEPGRSAGEKSLVLIEQGRYQGFGFVEAEFMDSGIEVLKSLVNRYSDNKDVRQIINLYLRQGKAEQVIEFA